MRPIFLYLGLILLLTGARQTPAPRLLITALLPDPVGSDAMWEWWQISNVGEQPIGLAGYKLGDAERAGGNEGMLRLPDVMLAPEQSFVIAQDADAFAARYGEPPDAVAANLRPYLLWASGVVQLGNGGDSLLLLDADNRVVDAASYGEGDGLLTPTVEPPLEGEVLVREPAGCDTNTAVDWTHTSTAQPWQLTLEGDCVTPPDPAIPIGVVQGSGTASPFVDEVVTVRGVVVGTHSDRNARGVLFHTLFIQNEPVDSDNDPTTSDGLAVFLGTESPPVEMGDRVLVTGAVTEFFGLTELDHDGLIIERLERDVPLPPALPLPSQSGRWDPADLESLEGMRVQLAAAQTAGPTHSACGFDIALPTLSLPRFDAETVLPVLFRRDERCEALPQLDLGDRVYDLVGVLTYRFDRFSLILEPDSPAVVELADWQPEGTTLTAAENVVTLASLNLENYFDTQRGTDHAGEPVPSAAELAAREAQFVTLIDTWLGCPTLIAVQEVENASLLASLADALEPVCGFRYGVAHRESIDVRGIDVALLHEERRATLTSAPSLLQACTALPTGLTDPTHPCPSGQAPLYARPPLRVSLLLDGARLDVVVVHFKSKRGGADATNAWREAQLAALLTELGAPPTIPTIIAGDFNDTPDSAMWAQFAPLAWQDWLAELPPERQYSYIFGGVAQRIDGIWADPVLAPQLHAATIVHTGSGFANRPVGPLGATDHDVPLVAFYWPELRDVTTSPTATRPELPAAHVTEAASDTQPTAIPADDSVARWPFAAIGAICLFLIGLGWVQQRRWRRRYPDSGDSRSDALRPPPAAPPLTHPVRSEDEPPTP